MSPLKATIIMYSWLTHQFFSLVVIMALWPVYFSHMYIMCTARLHVHVYVYGWGTCTRYRYYILNMSSLYLTSPASLHVMIHSSYRVPMQTTIPCVMHRYIYLVARVLLLVHTPIHQTRPLILAWLTSIHWKVLHTCLWMFCIHASLVIICSTYIAHAYNS